ncbi:MAG: PPOX class F420-dependent oxidoreductase [Lacisediminihabitans sp.]
MPSTPALLDLGDEQFVSLTTFRKTGVRVATTVWIARDGDALLVTTPRGSGKVKRLRNNPRVELQPSSRMGTVADDAPIVAGNAEILHETPALASVFRKKFGLQYVLFRAMEKLSKKRNVPHLILRITD